jgi:predicted nucleotidyltransferase
LVFSTPSISLIYVKYLYSLRNMRDTSDILDQLRGMRYELKERYHIRSIGIFGSYSRKHQTEQSDLDLVVEFDQPIGMMAFVHLKDLISDRLNIKVDLVTPEGLHPLIRDQVMHEVVYV